MFKNKLTTSFLLGAALISLILATACSDKRGFRSRRPVLNPDLVKHTPAEEGGETQGEGAGAEAEAQGGNTDDDQDEAGTGDETSGQDASLDTTPILDETDTDAVNEAAQLTAEIVQQPLTNEILEQIEQTFTPDLAKIVLGLSVTRAPGEGQTAISVDMAVRVQKQSDGSPEQVIYLVAENLLSSKEGPKPFIFKDAHEQFAPDGGQFESLEGYGSCFNEECTDVMILIRVLNPEGSDFVTDMKGAYRFVSSATDSVMTIKGSSVSNLYRPFEDETVQKLLRESLQNEALATNEQNENLEDSGEQAQQGGETQGTEAEAETVNIDADTADTGESAAETSEQTTNQDQSATEESQSLDIEVPTNDSESQGAEEQAQNQQQGNYTELAYGSNSSPDPVALNDQRHFQGDGFKDQLDHVAAVEAEKAEEAEEAEEGWMSWIKSFF